MDAEEFKQRTKNIGLRVIKLSRVLPKNVAEEVIARQLVRCATSVGANYRAACRSRSVAEKIAKLQIVEAAADETLYWLELLREAEIIPESRLKDLMSEVSEIVAMTVASLKTLYTKMGKEKATSQLRQLKDDQSTIYNLQ